MSPHSPRIVPLPVLGFALLATLATAGIARSAPASVASAAIGTTDDETALALARDRSARADAGVDSLKRALTPGHLTDSTPDADPTYGLETLRADYADLQRKAAGYRATLGDRHPTLVGTEQVMADLRSRLTDATRRALASAQREAAGLHAAADRIDRRLAAASQVPPAADPDLTGSIAPAAAAEAEAILRPRATTNPAALPPANPADRATEAAPPSVAAKAERAPPHHGSSLLIGTLSAGLALLLAAWAALRLVGAVPAGLRRPLERIEPAMAAAAPPADGGSAAPADAPAIAAPVSLLPADEPARASEAAPIRATLPLPRSTGAADVATLFAREPGGTLATAAAALHASLRAVNPKGPDARLTVLVTGSATPDDADGAALALVLAAAAAGRRAVILEARAAGRLRGALVDAGTAPILVEAGGAERTLYRVDVGPLTIAVLPTDAGEAEAAMAAAARPETGRCRGLDGLDLVVLVGDGRDDLASAADVVLVATATSEAIPDTAMRGREAGQAWAVVTLERPATPPATRPGRALDRRRIASDSAQATPARLGLRGTIEPPRRRAGR